MFEPSIPAYDDNFNYDFLVALVLLGYWAVLARRLHRLPHAPTAARLRRSSRRLALAAVIGALFVPARLVTSLVLYGYGWHFAADRLLIGVPVVALPVLATLVLTVPALRRLGAPAPQGAAETEPAPATRAAAAAPRVSFPARAVAVAGLVSFVMILFAPAPPLLLPALVSYAVLALVLVVIWRRHADRVHAGMVRPLPRGAARVRRAAVATGAVLVLIGGYAGWDWQTSKLPDDYRMTEHAMTYGTGPGPVDHAAHTHRAGLPDRPLTEFTGPAGKPDKRYTLIATDAKLKLSSGATVDATAFNGQIPGPELRVRQGELVEVTLVNRTADTPTTVHWHGLDVPNAEDGVAGLTQNAVPPGGSHVYRWRAEQVGTYWYHSHQASSTQVRRGLFGPLVIDPAQPGPAGVREFVVAAHVFDTDKGDTSTLNAADTLRPEAVAPGTPVRIRLINADNFRKYFTLAGTPFRVSAVDGGPVNAPTDLHRTKLMLGGGGRYDLEFTMPSAPVRLTDLAAVGAGLLLSPDGQGDLAPLTDGPEFDPTRYGSPAATPFGPDSDFDRSFDLVLDNRPGFYDGQPYYLWTINGHVSPHVPMLMVREGELVKVTISNRSFLEHPMHLHGHHVLVLSRNGHRATGSPLWLDTVTLLSGESYELAFRADNPGLWMDHCHNLTHAAMGMTMHLGYEGISTPFHAGRATGNTPE
ncbi:multicopper oxidase family protein [Micromonospora coerulea]|uniref:Multicopper oxidase family protein n=1 Tax=Micromonospora coerulea TaxID=47856 RepID=A0ABP8S5R5_9ACTN